jgi:hypothetical protein
MRSSDMDNFLAIARAAVMSGCSTREQYLRLVTGGNFGVGAKVAAGSRNPHGLEYRSWHQGQGSLVCFKRHPDGRWGLEPQRWENGYSDFWRPLGERDKPWVLRGQDHGTQVVLLGQHERHDTTQPPASVTDARRHWITRYLNARFLRLPTHVVLLVRERHDRQEPGQLQHVHGEQHHLDRHALARDASEAPRTEARLAPRRRRPIGKGREDRTAIFPQVAPPRNCANDPAGAGRGGGMNPATPKSVRGETQPSFS